MNKVTLFTAYYWTCPNCKFDNFSRPSELKLTEEEERELREEHGIDPDDFEGEWVMRPDYVVCQSCYEKYSTKE